MTDMIMQLQDEDVVISFNRKQGQFVSRAALRVSLSNEFNRQPLPDDFSATLEEVWNTRVTENPKLWNGTKFRLHSIVGGNQNQQDVTFNLGITCYKDFIGTNWSPHAKHLHKEGKHRYDNTQAYMSDALGVGSLVVTSDNQFILMKRSHTVGEAAGLYDIPGGHPEPAELVGRIDISLINICELKPRDVVNEIFDSTLKEICDEVNIPLSTLSDPLLMGVALNTTSAGRPSSEYFVKCSLSSAEVKHLYMIGSQSEAEETTSITFLSIDEVLNLNASTPLWKDIAPSAKGCIMLYQLAMRD